MKSLLIRLIIASIIGVILSSLGIVANIGMLQTLFTVLGIVFSISMSLLVAFNLSKVRNPVIRKDLRGRISMVRNDLLYDFVCSTLTLVASMIWINDDSVYHLGGVWSLNIYIISMVIISFSLFYEIITFRQLHRLSTDIEDAIISESENA